MVFLSSAAESADLPYTVSDGDRHFLLSNVECNGNETSLLNCKKDPWGSHQCKAHEVVGVVCQVKKGWCLKEKSLLYLLRY